MVFNENGEIINEGMISKLKDKINQSRDKKIQSKISKYKDQLDVLKSNDRKDQFDKYPIVGEINGLPIKLHMKQDKYNKNKSFYDNGIKKIKSKYSSAIKQVKSEMIDDGFEYEKFAKLPKLPIANAYLTDTYSDFYDDLVCCLKFELEDEKILPGNVVIIAMAVNDSGEFDAIHYAID